ncbi:hypothetical protein THOM_2192 [Trachipleistophora hominis]|uniref:Uncharacterized protein n=1 Tax=Trachipleistophora hominis TaxID=72359 RepID=L7JUA2_TRAHO|nr:hypothetical protein THOM_2192 [Trachipleistophora hominis]
MSRSFLHLKVKERCFSPRLALNKALFDDTYDYNARCFMMRYIRISEQFTAYYYERLFEEKLVLKSSALHPFYY